MRYVALKDVHEVIAAMQQESGLSVKAFGELQGVSRPTMSNIVNGNTAPSKQMLDNLGLALFVGVPDKTAKRKR